MSKTTVSQPKRRWPKVLLVVCAVLILLVVGSVFMVRKIYNDNLKPVNASQRTVTVTIPRGASVHDISVILKEHGLVKSTWAFEWYVRSKEVRDDLQAGTYELRPSQSVQEIVDVLTQGRIATNLVTILPAQRLEQIRNRLINSGFSEQDVDKALDPAMYQNHPALVDKPAGANLEGYLYPESFLRTAETKPETIIRASLDELQKHLTPDLRTAIVRQGLSVHEGIILASIVEKEVSKQEDRNQVAQVFLKRLRGGMRLESDPTALYGAAVMGQEASLRVDSPYNTYIYSGLPPGPISNVSESSLTAIAFPASTDFLYFVSGDDGNTYFSKTLEEHQILTEQHCKKLCSQ